ncbi:M56 family metallopeptidase [Arcicella rigui]|uniref:M56 family metallopeptidase n=1 Tax=Arcicella rigui TaxID=797020 RepID=A0ABU5QAX2_9BACT|nr:M56 family metallopeptidase [Arcicella rigui]MEA5139753.1 M56 family metallopeptidase [Arcicella rigui]
MKYLFESSVSMMLLYALYFFVYRNFTFVRLNRIYLLLSLVFSLLIPNFSWEVTELTSTPQKLVDFTQFYSIKQLEAFGNRGGEAIENPKTEFLNGFSLLYFCYFLGSALMLIRLMILTFKLFSFKKIPSKPYISTQGKFANSSFFNLIFIDDTHLEKPEIEQILAHERWHVRLLHSFDLLFVELVKIVFWFNPIVYLYQLSLAEVHEYEVDSRMVEQYHPRTYAHLLLKLAGFQSQPRMIHTFSRKPLSDRIHFLFTKQKSVPMKKFAYLSVLPILGLITMAFSFESVVKKIQEKPNKNVERPLNSALTTYPEVKVSDNKELYTVKINEKKGQIWVTMSPRKITPDLVNRIVAEQFKSFGFLVKVKNTEYNDAKKLNRIEISMEENEVSKKARDKKKVKVSDLPTHFSFNLNKMINKNPKDLDAMIVLFADKTTGEHFVAPLGPPPPPPPPMPMRKTPPLATKSKQ